MESSENILASTIAIPATPRLAYFENAFSRDSSDEITLPELINMVKGGTWQKQVNDLRATLAAGNRDAYDQAKRGLPAVMLSGYADTRRADAPAQERAIEHSGFMQGDFDGKDHPHLLAEGTTPAERVKPLMDLLRADPHVVAAFISPSGEGVKAVIRVPADTAGHRGAFEGAAEHFAKFGLKIDEATKDPGRLCFVSADPDAWIRDAKAAALIRPRKQAARGTGSGEFEPLDTTAEDIKEMLSFIPPRPDYEDWLRIASAVWSVLDENTGITLLNEWSPEEKPGEYQRKFKKRLREVRVGTLAWYAQANGFDAKEAARRKRWAGRIRFADGAAGCSPTPTLASDNADAPARLTDFAGGGPEDADNPQFVEHCLKKQQRGDAEIWLSSMQGVVLFDHLIGKWRYFDAECSIWKVDNMRGTECAFQETVCQAYNRLAAEMTKDIAAKPSENPKSDARYIVRKAAEDRVRALNCNAWKKGSLAEAVTLPRLSTGADQFDRHNHLLALENGVIDFDAGEFREAHPSDMLTHRAGVRFDPEATCPRFDAFLTRILVDPEVVSFVLRAMAYSLTGKVDEDVLFFLYGEGANGKSTFMLLLKLLMGDLMTTIDAETLLARKSDSTLDYKKSALEGKRVVVTDELPAGKKLAESMVKALIGGDEIVARRPYEKPYTFSPTHKLWMVGNHKPVIEGTDAGIWRRICLIPFTQTIPVVERRPRAEMLGEFRSELPGILNRLLVAWQEIRELGGLKPPQAVQDATNEYQKEEDQMAQFLDDRTSRVASGSTAAKALLKTYVAWCDDNGEKAVYGIAKHMLKRLRAMGFITRVGGKNLTMVDGLQLIPCDAPSDELLKV